MGFMSSSLSELTRSTLTLAGLKKSEVLLLSTVKSDVKSDENDVAKVLLLLLHIGTHASELTVHYDVYY